MNIDENYRVSVQKALETSTLAHTSFDMIQAQVFDLLCTDCFMGFRHTEIYISYKMQKAAKGMHPPNLVLLSFLVFFLSFLIPYPITIENLAVVKSTKLEFNKDVPFSPHIY